MTEDEFDPNKLPVPQENKYLRDKKKVELKFWPKLRRFAGKIPFARNLLSAYYAGIDPNTPLYVKAILMGALAYFIAPVDLIPDFLIGFGFTDDATVLLTSLKTVADAVKPEHREKADTMLQDLTIDPKSSDDTEIDKN